MPTQNIALSAQVDTAPGVQTISASPYSNGVQIAYSQPTSGVTITNVGAGGAQYRVNNGAWVVLEKNEGNFIAADLSVSRVNIKLVNDGAAATQIEYLVQGQPLVYVGRGGEQFPPDNPPCAVVGYPYNGALATAVPGTGYSFTAGQWYRNGVAISGQTALTYTRVVADIGTTLTFIPTGVAYSASGGITLADVPGAPTIGTATAGDGTASFAFTAPANNGGSAITLYRAIMDNAQIMTGGSSPIQFTGLPNGVARTAIVQAFNGIDWGPASAVSNSVTPAPITGMAPNYREVYVGDSIGAGAGSTSTSLALIDGMLTKGLSRRPLGFNQSAAGQTTTWLVSAPVLAAVNNLVGAVVRVHIGTNDITLTSNTPAQIAENIATACASYIANGTSYVIVDLIAPRNDGPGANTWQNLTALRQADLALANTAISALASDKIKINPVPVSWDINTDCTPDKLHFSDSGAAKFGAGYQAIMATLADQSLDIRTLYTDATNLLLAAGNPQLTGTAGTKTGGITGEVADGWTAAGAFDGTMACVASKVADFNGAIGQRFTFSGAAATAGRSISFSRSITFSGQIGDQYEGWIDFQLDAGNQGVRNPGLIVSVPGETSAETAGRTGTIVRTSAAQMAGAMRTYVGGVLTAPRTTMTINFVLTFDVGNTVAVATVGRPMARKVV